MLAMNSSTNNSSLAETDASVIQAELDRLLSDRRFSGARQMSAFLRYIVCETLKGNGSRIKAYTVGVDALGKPDDFDAQADPSVRVLALRLRKTLAAAYEDNSDCLARVVLRVGTYVPEFYKPEAFAESGSETKHTLQSPDHASVDDMSASGNTEDLSVKSQKPLEGGLGQNSISRHSDSHHRTDAERFRRAPMRQRGPLQEALAKNTAAFARTEMSLRDIRVPFIATVILLAVWQLTLNPANASVLMSDFPVEVSSADYQSVNTDLFTTVFAQDLD